MTCPCFHYSWLQDNFYPCLELSSSVALITSLNCCHCSSFYCWKCFQKTRKFLIFSPSWKYLAISVSLEVLFAVVVFAGRAPSPTCRWSSKIICTYIFGTHLILIWGILEASTNRIDESHGLLVSVILKFCDQLNRRGREGERSRSREGEMVH